MREAINLLTHYWLAITAVLLCVITVLSLTPAELPPAPGSDKLHHLIAYAALTIPLALKKPKYWHLITCCFLAYSGLIEIIQPYINRYGELLDMVANGLGIFCGWLFAELLSYFFPARLNHPD